jgi:hypothetical protein
MRKHHDCKHYERPAIAFGSELPKTWSRRHSHLIKMFAKGRAYRRCEPFTLHDKMVADERMFEGLGGRTDRLSWVLAHHPQNERAQFSDFGARQLAIAKWLSESVEEGREKERMRLAMKKDRKDDAKTAQIIRDVYRTCGDVKIDQVAKEFGHGCRKVFAKMVESGEIVNSDKGWVVK